MNKGKLRITVLFLFSAGLLSACGGGGGGGGEAPPPENNSPLVSGPIISSVSENDATFTIDASDLLANASDADNDELTVKNIVLQSGDSSAVSVNATSIDINPGVYNRLTDTDSEIITFTYTISDGNGGSVNSSLEITVTGVNDAPSRVALNNISLPNSTASSGGFLVGTLFGDDPEGDAISFEISGGDDAEHFSIVDDQLFIDDGILDFAVQSQYNLSVTATSNASVEFEFTVIVLQPVPLNVGYYDLQLGTGRAEQATPIQFIGETATNITDISTVDYSTLDMLFVQNPNSGSLVGPYIAQANLDRVADFVSNGGVLIFHDRHVTTTASILPDVPGTFTQDIGSTRTEFEVINDNNHVAQGPGGVITDTNLESANSLSFGFVNAETTPVGAMGFLSRNDANHWISYAYPVDQGWVIYSSIPLDFYLIAGNPEIMRSTYAPNILAQGRALLKKGLDTDGDGLLDVEETILGTAPDSTDTDGDGLLDSFEVRHGLDVVANDDSDLDPDNDGLTNLEEQLAGTQPRVADTDGDGLNDGDEVNTVGTDPLLTDTDGDLLSDFAEVNTHATDPIVADTDGGGTEDGREVLVDGTDPLQAGDDLNQVDIPLTLNDGNGFIWDIQPDGNINNGSNDAYDGGMRLSIDNIGFPQFNAATALQNGRELNLGLANISGLAINRRIYVPENQAFVRYLENLTNPTDTDITVELRIDTNLGSDGNTVIVSTSDGDTAIEAVDFWVVTDDTSNGGGDPSLAHVYAGPSSAVTPVVTAPLGRIAYTYNVTIPANGRAIIMHFDSQNANRTVAMASANNLLSLGAGTMDGLSVDDMQDIVNFDLAGVGATTVARKISANTQSTISLQ